MTQRPRLLPPRLTALLTASLALSAQAGAQDLDAYQALRTHLEGAAQSVGHNSLTTLNELDAAQQALDKLAPTLQNDKLAQSLSDTLLAARAAQARTPAELQAQVALARGLMRKGLYDQTVTALATSPDTAAERLGLLANEVGANPASIKAQASAGKTSEVTRQLQKAATAKLSSSLSAVTASKSPGNYLNLARATSWFVVVQDAGKALNPPLTVEQFNTALGQLTAGDTAALSQSLKTLRAGTHDLSVALASAKAGAGTPPKAATTASKPVTSTPATKPTSASHTGTGLNAAYAALGRALAASGHGDMAQARTQLATLPAALAGAPASVRHAAGYDALVQHAQSLSTRKGLRPSDVQALTSELGNLEQAAQGKPTSTLDSLSGTASRAFGGPVRAIFALLLALAAFAPLRLLNLAFGGRNPAWRAIGGALVLLLLPTFLDGFFGFLGWLGDLANVPFLRSLTNFSLSQGAYGLPLRGLLTLAAVALATYGFRELCIQFGVLGGPRRAPRKRNDKRNDKLDKPVSQKTQADPNDTSVAPHTLLDWDEDVE